MKGKILILDKNDNNLVNVCSKAYNKIIRKQNRQQYEPPEENATQDVIGHETSEYIQDGIKEHQGDILEEELY